MTPEHPMKQHRLLIAILALLVCPWTVSNAAAQGFETEPVFSVQLEADRSPLVAGDTARLAVTITIDRGWHINTDDPGDEFSVPTEVRWGLPEGWTEPTMLYPAGKGLEFNFGPEPTVLQVWDGTVTIVGDLTVPADAAVGPVPLKATVLAQACNDTQCLPPIPVSRTLETEIVPIGTPVEVSTSGVFAAGTATPKSPAPAATETDSDAVARDLADRSLPLFLIGVFFAGLALNLTPCVFPLIPITVGFFSQQAKDRSGGTFWLALAYVMGIAVTYSAIGVGAALSGALFGAALQNPFVVGGIVFVLLALATSMFGLWEFRVPGWAQRASGGRAGVVGALLMGLLMGFVAAPCIGPFVLGLLTFVGQKGDPFFGFLAFFTLSLGLGLPYLVLGTFTGAVNRLPQAGMWMVGVRRVFGVLLIAMAAYFAAPLLPGILGDWLMPVTLALGALYLLIIDRTGHEQPGIDRVMRLLSAVMLVAGVWLAPTAPHGSGNTEHLDWMPYDAAALEAAVASGDPVIVDFWAEWCVACKELDAITFPHPEVAAELSGYARFKVDQTKRTETNEAIAETYGVRGLPTVIVYEGGVEKFRITGFEKPERFLQRLR
jgi:thiol:disulfide interchange protein DsbD